MPHSQKSNRERASGRRLARADQSGKGYYPFRSYSETGSILLNPLLVSIAFLSYGLQKRPTESCKSFTLDAPSAKAAE